MGNRWLAAALLILLPSPAAAQDRAAKLDAFFGAHASSGGLNGNVLVAEKGRVIYARSFGYADFENQRPNAADTEFEMASVGKLFTAVAILQLVERGSIALDAPLARYVPEFPYKGVTVRQLLSHSSGMSEQEIAPSYAQTLGRPMEMRDLVPAIAASGVSPALKQGEKWWYSNLGYQLLARLVEVRSGQRFDAYLASRILRPAGMRQTYLKSALINRPDTPLFAQNYAYPLRFSNQRTRLDGAKSYYNGRTYGNGGIVSTTGDMLRFDRALRDGRLLKPATLDSAVTPQKLADGTPVHVWLNFGGMGEADLGLGWFIFRDRSEGRIAWHAGGMPGCVTIFMRNLDSDQTVVIFDNTESENVYRMGLSALRMLNGRAPMSTPRSLTRIYARTLAAEGEDAAFVALLQNKDDTTSYSLSANDLNNLGYHFSENGRVTDALSTFRAAIALWPSDDNLSESYGEMLEAAGRRDQAAAMYRRALRLNPDNADAKARLKLLEGPAK